MKRAGLLQTVSLLAIIVLMILSLAGAAAEEPEQVYVENQYNYVEGSLDVSQGIPEYATGVLDRIRRNGVLRVATEPYFAPQEFIDPEKTGQEQYAGADMELARLIAERMGVELEIIPMEFTDVLPALSDDKCDLTISAIAFTPGRASGYTMSKGYYFTDSAASTAFIIREEDRESITGLADLADKTLIVQSSSLQEAIAAKHVHDYKEFRRVSSVQTVYEAVEQGKADAGVVDLETAQAYIRNNPGKGLCIADNLYFELEPAYQGDRIAAKKGEVQLIYFVNGVIDEVLESGLYRQWMEDAEKRAAELGL